MNHHVVRLWVLCLLCFYGFAPAPAEEIAAAGKAVGWRGDGTGRYPDAQPPATWDVDAGKNILWRTKVGRGQIHAGRGRRPRCSGRGTRPADVRRSGQREDPLERDQLSRGLPPGGKRPEAKPPTAEGCGYHAHASLRRQTHLCNLRHGNRRLLRSCGASPLDPLPRTTADHSVWPRVAGARRRETPGEHFRTDRAGPADRQRRLGRPRGPIHLRHARGGEDGRRRGGDHARRRLRASGRRTDPARKLADTIEYVSPVVDAGVVFFVDSTTVALRLPAKPGETIRPEKVSGERRRRGRSVRLARVPRGDDLFVSRGVLYAMEAASGKLAYKKELEIRSAGGKAGGEPADLYPSLTLAGNFLLVSNDVGEMLVLAPGKEYKQIARNSLDKGSGASPVPCGSRLLLRSGTMLYCIGSR